MMWQLSFLVMVVRIVHNISDMLHYICPMHTLLTVMVHLTLANTFVLFKGEQCMKPCCTCGLCLLTGRQCAASQYCDTWGRRRAAAHAVR